jgi:putative acetyltransferase
VIRPATPQDLEEVRTLFREYAASLNTPICFQGFERELAELPGSYHPILVASCDTARAAFPPPARCGMAFRLSACVALRPLSPTIGEMKRLYVRPEYRGQGLGRQLTEAIIEAARRQGFQTLRLDTLPHLHEAIALYRQLGFHDIAPYNDNPAPGVLFLELPLCDSL